MKFGMDTGNDSSVHINPFHATGLFIYTLKAWWWKSIKYNDSFHTLVWQVLKGDSEQNNCLGDKRQNNCLGDKRQNNCLGDTVLKLRNFLKFSTQ